MVYRDCRKYIFVIIIRKKLLFEPSVGREFDTKGVPLSTYLGIFRKNKVLIFKK